jgi:hypothetical protein
MKRIVEVNYTDATRKLALHPVSTVSSRCFHNFSSCQMTTLLCYRHLKFLSYQLKCSNTRCLLLVNIQNISTNIAMLKLLDRLEKPTEQGPSQVSDQGTECH